MHKGAAMDRNLLAALGGLGFGTALGYWFDPDVGRRRRARLSDKARHWSRKMSISSGRVARDFAHRSEGILARSRSRLSFEHASDDLVAARVHTALGWVCSHPGAVEVSVRGGKVWLHGDVLKDELKRVIAEVGKVRGVREVEHDFRVHDRVEGVSALQGGAVRRGHRSELLQDNWAPAVRLGAGAVGLGLVGGGMLLPRAVGVPLSGAGGLLLARAYTNLPVKRLVGLGAGRRGIDLVKTVHVNAPPEEVFAFWHAAENFPRFMSHVKEVTPKGDGRYHWKVSGPAGTSFQWDGEISAFTPNRSIAWRSLPGAMVGNAGVVRFDEENGGTRVHIRMTYMPPVGYLGHIFARILGADPKRQLDDDMLRFKSLLEKGKATAHHRTVLRDELDVQPPLGTH